MTKESRNEWLNTFWRASSVVVRWKIRIEEGERKRQTDGPQSMIYTHHRTTNQLIKNNQHSTMTRKFFVGGNWKCNGTLASLESLITTLNNAVVPGPEVVEVVVAPAFVHIPMTLASLRKDFAVSAQDCWTKGNGAYTGEVSADMLADLGLPWVILGHSERRHIIQESDDFTADKVVAALSRGLSVIYCIGEKLEEREAGDTISVCTRQLNALATKLKPDDWSRIVVAYEPVWAIGTGKVATSAQAQEVHAAVRSWFVTTVGADVAAAVRIIYGGSVNAANCKELTGMADIDGFLVGGASLKPEFIDIIKSVEAST